MVNSTDFIERLEYLLEYYDLNASAFADKIQVQRSNISHLMSGRNKPSLEFVLKVVKQFPEVNLYWLLNGKGTFPSEEKTERTLGQDADSQGKTTNRLENLDTEIPSGILPQSLLEKRGTDLEGNRNTSDIESKILNPVYDDQGKRVATGQQKENPLKPSESSVPSKNHGKDIDRIVIFYSNGSFESFSNQ